MAEETVKILLEVHQKNVEYISDLKNKLKDAEGQVGKMNQKLAEFTEKQEKVESVNIKLRRAILAFRKEMFAVALGVGAVVGVLKALAGTSDALAERFERLGDIATRALQPVGDFTARLLGGGGRTRASQMELLTLQSEILELRGRQHEALMKKMEAEEIRFNQNQKRRSQEERELFERNFRLRQLMLQETSRLSEFGLQRQAENVADLKRQGVGGAQSATADTIFKFLQAEHQTLTEVLKSFQTSINRAMADFLARSLFTAIFKNFDPVLRENQRQTKLLEDISGCVCRLPPRTAGMAGEMTITGGARGGVLGAIGSIAGLIGGISGAGALAGAMGGVTGIGGALPQGAGIEFGAGAMRGVEKVGNLIPRFQGGGEVPILAHRGEFVVNRTAAASNKELLKEINSGAKGVRGATNVFLIRTNDANSFAEMLSTPSAQNKIVTGVVRNILLNGDARRVIKDFAR